MRSTSRWISVLPALGVLDEPGHPGELALRGDRAARTASRSEALTVPRVTVSSLGISTGSDSAPSMEIPMGRSPSVTVPSVVVLSPGRTAKRSRVDSCPTGISASEPSRSTETASLVPSSIKARSALPAFRWARAFGQRPRRRHVTTSAAASRWIGGEASEREDVRSTPWRVPVMTASRKRCPLSEQPKSARGPTGRCQGDRWEPQARRQRSRAVSGQRGLIGYGPAGWGPLAWPRTTHWHGSQSVDEGCRRYAMCADAPRTRCDRRLGVGASVG